MKRFLLAIAATMCLLSVPMNAQMTDDQVVEYVKTAASSGKSETQIAQELVSRGVSRSQLERLRDKYQGQVSGQVSTSAGALSSGRSLSSSAALDTVSDDTVTVPELQANRYVDAVAKLYGSYENGMYGNSTPDLLYSNVDFRPGDDIFGHNLFNGTSLTFEPNENVATPENYRLGPGDEVVIEVWGLNEDTIRQVISPEGRISISMVGPVYLDGLTIKEAEAKIKKVLASKYAGISGENPGSSVSVSLGNIRTIRVNVMGEVENPGTYRLSSFSSVFNALYRAGGVTPSGSLRAIKLMRNGEELATVDVYSYLFDGESGTDITLMEGDVIVVPPYVSLVSVYGGVKRPMRYEMISGEPVQKLIEYSGGFAGNAFKGDVSVIRVMNEQREIYTVVKDEFPSFALEDGDVVGVRPNLSRFSNRVEVRGYVFRPGMYELGGDIATLRQLVEAAGGVTEDAFLDRAVLHREKDNFDYENLSVDLGKLLSGAAEDVLLRRNDVLTVSGLHDVTDRGTLTINGFVSSPGEFPYAENTTVEDLILMAGGLMDGASTARVDVARRVYDPASTEVSDTLGYSFTYSIDDSLSVDKAESFVLEPYDVVSVRKSPGYRPQQFVSLDGQVLFPGDYVILNEGERISSLVKRAGGFTSTAYLDGARIVRRYRDSDILGTLNQSLQKIGSSTQRDSVEVSLANEYVVSLDLAAAMDRPGTEADIVLQEGDRIIVPEYVNTVQIVGEVMFPNAVVYVPGKPLKYYINAAGGFTQNAKRSKAYVIYMNGSAARSGIASAKVEPGSTIVVPTKPDRRPVTTTDVMATASMATSLTSMVAMLVNLIAP